MLLLAASSSLATGDTHDHLTQKAALLALRRNIDLAPDQLDAGWSHWAMNPDFRVEADRLTLRRPVAVGLPDLLTELIDWRLAGFTGAAPPNEMDEPSEPFRTGPQLWREYMREEVPPLFGAVFNPGNWNTGIVPVDKNMILLTTLKKGSMSVGNHYEDRFLSPSRLQ